MSTVKLQRGVLTLRDATVSYSGEDADGYSYDDEGVLSLTGVIVLISQLNRLKSKLVVLADN